MAKTRTWRSRGAVTIAAMLSLIVLTALAFIVPIPYGSMRPGPAFNTLGEFEQMPMIEFGDDATTYPTEGALYFTTVSVTRRDFNMSLAQAIGIYFQPNSVLVPIDVLHPSSQTQEESEEISAAQLDQSKEDAEVAGVRAAGFNVDEWAEVVGVLDDSPAKGVLKPGDRVTKINNVPTPTPEKVVELILQLKVGEPVDVTIQRDGNESTHTFTTYATKDEPDRPRVGVELISGYDVPLEVDNNVGHSIGGPSAGTMFALAIYDKLTPGALTGGKSIGGTGTISSDGTVGTIGGVQQKMAGAAKQGATLFLIPANNCGEAMKSDDFGMEIVKIQTLNEAITAIEQYAKGDTSKLPRCEN